MKKLVLRVLALVLVLCMVVPCMPVLAYAEETCPEGMTDAEWELLRQKQLEQLAAEQAAAEAAAKAAAEAEKAAAEKAAAEQAQKEAAPPSLEETDKLTESKGNLVVTDTADVTPDSTIPEKAPAEVKDQIVSVELPDKVDENHKITNNNTYEYEATIDNKDAKVEESYDLNADITAVETEGSKVTDITYNISLDGSIAAKDGEGNDVVESTVVGNVDIAANQAAEEANLPAPQYKVDMTANGMNAKEITRVEHTYYTPKQSSTTSSDSSTTEETEAHTEYYYNAANGTEDTTKKYFSIVEKVKEGTENVKEKVVSLWTSFLGIFHITTDAFEGAEKTDGTKDTYSDLTTAAANNAGKTVEMLRDYKTNSTATISNNVTVDLNDNKYTNTDDTSEKNAAIEVTSEDNKVTIQHGDIISNGDGIVVSGKNNELSLWDVLVRSNADNDKSGDTAAVQVNGSGNTVNIGGRSWIDGTRSTYGVYSKSSGTDENAVNISKSKVEGKTGVSLANSSARLSGSILRGTSGAALAVDGNTKANDVVITGGRFESGKDVANIYAKDEYDIASITVKGGRYTKPAGLYSYIPYGYALISHNDGSYFLYEVVGTDYTPTRDGYAFQGYTDANGKAISLKEAFRKGIIAYAQWKEIPETETKQVPLITVKTDEKGCTTKVIFKGDTAFVTVKDAKGELAPISEVVIPSIKRLQNKKIDTVEIQVDEDVSLVLDIEKAKENGFTDIVEVMLEKDMLLITSGQDTCIELDIAELKEADKPVTIQLVEGKLTIMLGKNSSMTVDLTKALKTKERIVVKLESGVLKLYDKYHKPIKE